MAFKRLRKEIRRDKEYSYKTKVHVNNLYKSFRSFHFDCTNPCLHITDKSKNLVNKYTKLYVTKSDNDNDDENIASFDTDSSPILADTGASFSYTFDKNDFISYKPYNGVVSGLGDAKIIGIGTVQWRIIDDAGDIVPITIYNCYHIPDINIRLLSPQMFFRQFPRKSNAHMHGNQDILCLSWGSRTKTIK